jgi:hypothetical protein
MITRGFDPFLTGNFAGAGRWGLFMEGGATTLGIPAGGSGRRHQFVSYNDNSTINKTYMTILENGNVGIGTNIPSNLLDINGGDLSITGGNIFNNSFLLHGRDTYYFSQTSATTTTSTTFQIKLTGTTGSLSSGLYNVITTYNAGGTGTNTGRFLECDFFIDNTSGQLVHTAAIPFINNSMDFPISNFSRISLTSGIHTLLVRYRTTNGGTGAILSNVQCLLYRIS